MATGMVMVITDLGVYSDDDQKFYIDSNGDNAFLPRVDRTSAPFILAGDIPTVGDWDGDGVDEIGVYRPDDQKFYLDADGDDAFVIANDTVTNAFGLVGDVPIIGAWSGDLIGDVCDDE